MLVRASEDRSQEFVGKVNGTAAIVDAMRTFPSCRDLQELGLILFAVVCEFPQNRLSVVKAGGLRVADAALQRHQNDVPVVLLAQKAIVKFCKQQHLYNEDGKHAFRFYQEPLRASAMSSNEKEAACRVDVSGPSRSLDGGNELALNLVKALLKPK